MGFKQSVQIEASRGILRNTNESPGQQHFMVKVKGTKDRDQIIIAAKDQFDFRKRQRFSESTSPMKNQRSFVLDSNSNYSSQSTSIGSEVHGRQSLMLPREHNMTKD